jgi:hypothetical protein
MPCSAMHFQGMCLVATLVAVASCGPRPITVAPQQRPQALDLFTTAEKALAERSRARIHDLKSY